MCLGLLGAIGIGLVNGWNDHVENTLLASTHFPLVAIVVLALLVFGVNVVARRRPGRRGLAAGELLLVWSMLGVAGGIASCGMMRYFPPWMVCPAHYASTGNEAGPLLLRHLPDWMVVSRDGTDPAVRWFMEGMPRGQRLPWGAWVVPLAAWSLFALALFAAQAGLAAILHGAWSSRERLLYPLVVLPRELAREAPAGRMLNNFLRRPLLWAGMAVPLLIHGINGLKTWWPGTPSITLAWPASWWFADRPWSEFSLGNAHVYFSVLGLAFLLPAELSFSLWVFYVLFRLSFVWIAWLGSGATGFWGDWSTRLASQETGGATLVLCAVLLWGARGEFRRAARPLLALIMAGLAGMVVWLAAGGMSWWAAAFLTVMFTAVLVVLARLVAETGFLVAAGGVFPTELLAALAPAGWITGPTAAVSLLQRGVFMQEYREILMPYVLHGLKACEAARLKARPVLAALALAALAGLAASAYGRIATSYKVGAVNMDFWQNVFAAQWFIGDAANARKNPKPFEWITAGDRRVAPVAAAHVGTGAALMGGLLLLRERLPWFPLSPIAAIPATIWVMYWGGMWFSIFLGWLCKAATVRFGVAVAYRGLLPLFLGFALGEFLIAGVFTVLGLALGQAPPSVLP